MDGNSQAIAICPLINFQISEILVGDSTPDEAREYFKILREKLERGIEIWNNFKIRRINKEEIEALKEFGVVNYWAGISRITMRTFVMEISRKSMEERRETLRRIYELLLAMRLYKADNVFCKVILYAENANIKSLTILDPPVPERTGVPYAIQLDEVDRIRKIANKIKRIDFDKRTSLRIACERFSRSYEEHREDEKIIDFMIAFETLFLRGKKAPANAGQFIGLGCSMLLGRNDKERKEINEFLVEAYSIRNKIVHGSEFATPIKINNEIYEIDDFILQLQNYLRESIKNFI